MRPTSRAATRPPLPTVALAAPGMLIAEALGRLVREAGLHVVGCYATLAALVEKIQRCRPAVVIADSDLREHGRAAFGRPFPVSPAQRRRPLLGSAASL